MGVQLTIYPTDLQVTLSEKGEHRLSVQLKVGDNSVELSSVKSKDRICGWDTVLMCV